MSAHAKCAISTRRMPSGSIVGAASMCNESSGARTRPGASRSCCFHKKACLC